MLSQYGSQLLKIKAFFAHKLLLSRVQMIQKLESVFTLVISAHIVQILCIILCSLSPLLSGRSFSVISIFYMSLWGRCQFEEEMHKTFFFQCFKHLKKPFKTFLTSFFGQKFTSFLPKLCFAYAKQIVL